eukprot:COSAG05_NODE_3430_length_2071_cov_2.082150_3_plen_110_part_00
MQLQPISILSYEELWDLVDAHDSKAYARTRNYLSGAVSRLSPYISRGVLSVIDIIDHLNQQNKLNKHTEKWVNSLLARHLDFNILFTSSLSSAIVNKWHKTDHFAFGTK